MSLAAPAPAAPMLAPSDTVREAICAALRTVVLPDGTRLDVSRHAPQTPSPFCAWPKWAVSTYVGARLAIVADHEYDVLVLLPSPDQATTTELGDTTLAAVVTALWPLGRITTAQPAQVLFDAGQGIPALQIRLIPHPITTS